MADTPRWLKEYFGARFSGFSPVVTLDGKTHAIVQLSNNYSTGFVLLKKSGRFSTTPQLSLHEGTASAEDLARMKAALAKADG